MNWLYEFGLVLGPGTWVRTRQCTAGLTVTGPRSGTFSGEPIWSPASSSHVGKTTTPVPTTCPQRDTDPHKLFRVTPIKSYVYVTEPQIRHCLTGLLWTSQLLHANTLRKQWKLRTLKKNHRGGNLLIYPWWKWKHLAYKITSPPHLLSRAEILW